VRKIVLLAIGAIVVVAVGAAGLVYWFFSGDGLRLAIEQQATAFLGQPVKVARARAGIFPRTAIHLSDVRVGEPARVTLADVDVSTDFRELLSRRIQDATITIANSRIEMPLPFALPPSSEGDPAANAPGNPAGSVVQIVSVRTIALDDLVLVSRGRKCESQPNRRSPAIG
jgi:hypothetical protein